MRFCIASCRSVTDPDWRMGLAARATGQLGRFGVAGRVKIEGQLAWLIGHGPTVDVRLTENDALAAQQGPSELNVVAERIAGELARARRRAVGKVGGSNNWIAGLKLMLGMATLAAVAGAAFYYLTPRRNSNITYRHTPGKGQSVRRGSTAPLDVDAAASDQHCTEVFNRIQRGGSVTPLDIDGWVVELSLVSNADTLTPDLPVLNDYFERRSNNIERQTKWANSPQLDHANPALAGVLVSKEPLVTAIPGGRSGIVIAWRGQYVATYFSQTDRQEYVRLAHSLYVETGAQYGALHARCVHSPSRSLGAWYRGPNVSGALSFLAAHMELFADNSSIPGSAGARGPEDLRKPLEELWIRLKAADRRKATYLLATAGGSVSERPGQFATLEFPFSPGNRAALAAHNIARNVWPSPSSR